MNLETIRMKRILLLGALAAQAIVRVSAQQVDSNSITVSSTKTSSSVTPDQVVFAITVTTPLNTNLSDVLTAVQSAGLTSGNFTNVYQIYNNYGSSPVQQLVWSFTLTAPFSKLKDTIGTLTTLQKSPGPNSIGFLLSFQIQGTQTSQQLQQSQTCSFADLLAGAQTQAQSLATASGLNLGVILALSSSVSNTTTVCSATVRFAATRY
jgi:uncharacterized protein YggE